MNPGSRYIITSTIALLGKSISILGVRVYDSLGACVCVSASANDSLSTFEWATADELCKRDVVDGGSSGEIQRSMTEVNSIFRSVSLSNRGFTSRRYQPSRFSPRLNLLIIRV